MLQVTDRAVDKLGAVLAPHLNQLGADDPTLSPARSTEVPRAPIYLLHGSDDTVIPAAESALLAEHLRLQGAEVHLLLSGLITHAELDRSAPLAGASQARATPEPASTTPTRQD